MRSTNSSQFIGSQRNFFLYLSLVFILLCSNSLYSQQTIAKLIPLEENLSNIPEESALLTLVINDATYGDVEAKIANDGPLINIVNLAEGFKESLTTEIYNTIFKVVFLKLTWISKSDLAYVGIDSEWDDKSLKLSLSSPAGYSPTSTIDFYPPIAIQGKELVKPSPISGVLNINSSGSLAFPVTIDTIPPLSLNADLLVKFWDIALEANGGIQLGLDDFVPTMGKVRVVYDIPKFKSRLLGGMITGEGISYQMLPEIIGISIKNLDIFDEYDRKNSPAVKFVLEKSSTIRIVSNGSVIRTLHLAKGVYRIFDLPFIYGLNDFELQIFDSEDRDFKVFKPLNLLISTESDLLVGGKFEYGASLGVGKTELDQPFLSSYARYGLFYNLTTSAFIQANLSSALLGGTLVFTSKIGSLRAELGGLGAWDGRDTPFAFASNLQYTYIRSTKPALPTFGFSAGWSSAGFTAPLPSSSITSPDPELRLGARIGGNIANRFSYSLSGNWSSVFATTTSNSINIGLNLDLIVDSGTSIQFNSTATFGSEAQPSIQATISLSMVNPLRTSARIKLDQSLDGKNSINYADTMKIGNGINYYIDTKNITGYPMEQTIISTGVRTSLSHVDVSMNSSVIFGGSPNALPRGSIGFNTASGLVFAGGKFAISRPISDSFALFIPKKDVYSRVGSITVDAGAAQITQHKGPLVLPLTSYRDVIGTVDFPDSEADIRATIPHSILSSGYRTGFVYPIDILKSLWITGILKDKNNMPIRYTAGQIVDIEGDIFDTTFTYQDGSFEVYGLIPGMYKIIWAGDIGITSLNLENRDSESVDLGVIVIEPSQRL